MPCSAPSRRPTLPASGRSRCMRRMRRPAASTRNSISSPPLPIQCISLSCSKMYGGSLRGTEESLVALEEINNLRLVDSPSCDAEIDFFENLIKSTGRPHKLADARLEEVLELGSGLRVAERISDLRQNCAKIKAAASGHFGDHLVPVRLQELERHGSRGLFFRAAEQKKCPFDERDLAVQQGVHSGGYRLWVTERTHSADHLIFQVLVGSLLEFVEEAMEERLVPIKGGGVERHP